MALFVFYQYESYKIGLASKKDTRMNIKNLTLLLLLFVVACKSTKDIVYTTPMVDMEETILDTMEISAPSKGSEETYELARYNPSYTRTIDLIHTKLNLKFDWQKQHVLGIADLTVKPVFYTTNTILLHATNFDINNIKINGTPTTAFEYDGEELIITHTKEITRSEEVIVTIDYVAKPNEGPVGGSAAITSDKGLFFINPLNEEPNKPQQIWTQGETENNSRWFPTIDRPNERCTQEIYVTVQDRFKSLSNGKLISSTANANGTRTDYWKQDKPHAPYLFMLAIGEYSVTKDSWNGKPVEYYVEEEYATDAKEIFNHTPEMIGFFSDILDYPYPWDKYSSVICRDYVSGAMENTSAVIFGEFVQKNHRQLIDNDNDLIVAHELFHHWFGDLVTCESWANLTLNEGFANYSEYLWYEHKYGKMRADLHRITELRNYVGSVENQGGHPLIHYGFQDKEDMFDAHSYNKGGLVLHMLRSYLGDDAFFAGLHRYLVDNEYTAVETDELRMAFEDVTGQDLNWFFDQWYFESGHPQLDVKYDFDTNTKEIVIQVEQLQDPKENAAIYQLPTTVRIYDETGKKHEIQVLLNERSQELRLKVSDLAPQLVMIDGDDILLAEITEKRSTTEYEYMATYDTPYKYKVMAMQKLKGTANAQPIYMSHLDHPFYGIRSIATQNIEVTDKVESLLVKQVELDPHSRVRSKSLTALTATNPTAYTALAKDVLKKQEAYPVVAEALTLLSSAGDVDAVMYAEQLQDEKSGSVASAVADIFIRSKDSKYADYFTDKIMTTSIYELFPLMNKYGKYVEFMKPNQLSDAANKMSSIALNPEENNFKKFMITSAINNMKNSLKSRLGEGSDPENQMAINSITQLIDTIKSTETNEGLLSRYQGF